MNSSARAWLGLLLLLAGGCQSHETPAGAQPSSRPTVLRVGLGSVDTSSQDMGLGQVVRNQAVEPLFKFAEDGRPVPFLVERWQFSDDARTLKLQLKNIRFHDGSPFTGADVVDALQRTLPRIVGGLYDDIEAITATSEREVQVTFRRPSSLAIEALDVQVAKKGAPNVGTGPFVPESGPQGTPELAANPDYHLGRPGIERILLRPYPSVRSAWADLLRGQVDMLYEVGVDAIDSLEPSSQVKLYSYRRHYATVIIFNMRRDALRDAKLRRQLNASVDRERLVADALDGLGRPAAGPIWPEHWANDNAFKEFEYDPEFIPAGRHLKLNCIFPNVLNERLSLTVQRQLQSVGVDLVLESLPLDEFASRFAAGAYDLLLTEVVAGPGLVRPYTFWHSKGPFNFGAFHSSAVDGALESIRDAPDDRAYRAGVTAFREAIKMDPPAIFLAWSERARAVSTAFEVPAEPGRDIVNAIHLWRPADRTMAPAAN